MPISSPCFRHAVFSGTEDNYRSSDDIVCNKEAIELIKEEMKKSSDIARRFSGVNFIEVTSQEDYLKEVRESIETKINGSNEEIEHIYELVREFLHHQFPIEDGSSICTLQTNPRSLLGQSSPLRQKHRFSFVRFNSPDRNFFTKNPFDTIENSKVTSILDSLSDPQRKFMMIHHDLFNNLQSIEWNLPRDPEILRNRLDLHLSGESHFYQKMLALFGAASCVGDLKIKYFGVSIIGRSVQLSRTIAGFFSNRELAKTLFRSTAHSKF